MPTCHFLDNKANNTCRFQFSMQQAYKLPQYPPNLGQWSSTFIRNSKEKIGISDAGTPQPDRDLDAETLLVKLKLDTWNSKGVIMFSMQLDLTLVWKFINIEVFEEFHVKNNFVKLQHNAGKFWGVIKFSR